MAPKKTLYDQWTEEVIPDLSGKAVAITGTTSGTGFWTAVMTIKKNVSHLFLLNRKSERSDNSLAKLQKEVDQEKTTLYQIDCDLQSFQSVREAAEKINEECKALKGLNVLGNNAGIMWFPDTRTDDGYEVQMQTNHFSQVLLAKLLMPSFDLALDNGEEVRIVHMSSGARSVGKPHAEKYFQKIEAGKLGGDGTGAKYERYHQSKLANVTFTLMLHKELQKVGYDVTKIKASAGEPGHADTDIINTTKKSYAGSTLGSIFLNFLRMCLRLFVKRQSAQDGSLSFAHACFGAEVESGDFYIPANGTVGKPMRSLHKGVLDKGKQGTEKAVLDGKNQEIVWKQTEEAIGSFFEHSAKKGNEV